MASENGRASADLSDRLFHEPHRFDFFQAVRLLEQVVRERAGQDERWRGRPVGRDDLPDQEGVRFRVLPSLAFPTSAVAQIQPPDPEARSEERLPDDPLPPVDMVVTFLGLVGANGVLPHHYTAMLLRRMKEKDFSLRDFLDLFHHRLVSFFYRAWEKYRLPFAHERFRLDPGGPEDLTTWALYCLVGMGTSGLRGRLKVDDEAFVYYSGHFAHFPRCAAALEPILEDYFELPIRVQQLQGQWLHLSPADRSRVSGTGRGRGNNNRVGIDLVVGGRVWDVQSKFRLRVGPVGYAQFRRLMPNGDRLLALGQMARTYAGPDLDFDVQPVLKAAEVPPCRLASQAERFCLGWNTWVHSRPMTQDAEDAVFSVAGL